MLFRLVGGSEASSTGRDRAVACATALHHSPSLVRRAPPSPDAVSVPTAPCPPPPPATAAPPRPRGSAPACPARRATSLATSIWRRHSLGAVHTRSIGIRPTPLASHVPPLEAPRRSVIQLV